ncbi:SDR family oxidoreductase [Sphaerisporangium sp. NPDC051011]|uniref:SDR family NAD(P)-dependent oxidoreductase n=1 Tax=Sphaerisporangium sp. NPDC051011 TaxID=3155792 RepID=UPI00340DEC58
MRLIDLQGKRAVVVGGATGIGWASAVALAEAGACVVTLSRRDRLTALPPAPEVAERITHRRLDVADADAVTTVFTDLCADGGIDIVVLSAAVIEPSSAEETDDELWRRHMDVNVDGIFRCARASIRHMKETGRRGKIVVVGSVSGMVGNPGFAAYCASKGLWVNLTRQMALDCAPVGINVNSILPGFTSTELTDIYDAETKATIAAAVPTKVWARPEQIADAILFLSSPLADYVHGANLPVDGGYLAAGPI